jgi:uncharacterized membrane protein HdeD (DUF308 family)
MLFAKSMMSPDRFDGMSTKIERELREHQGKHVFQGVMFIIAGIIAAAFPAVTAINVELIVGVILLFTGGFQFVLARKSEMHWWTLFSACLSVGFGIILLWQPLFMLRLFVTFLAIFMTLEGTAELFLSFQFRPVRNWGWMFFSGIITLVLATFLWIGWPLFDVLYLGWVIAINLIFYGLSLLMLVGNAAQLREPEEKQINI